MTWTVTRVQDGVVHLRISGLMEVADHRSIQAALAGLPPEATDLRVVVELDGFRGWEKDDEAWGDLGFLLGSGQRVSRLAVVGQERWRDPALLFVGKGFRPMDIEFFPSPAQAEDWVLR